MSPQANSAYWSAKIAANRARDLRQNQALEAAGWTVIRVWEHHAAEVAAGEVEAALALKQGRGRATARGPQP